MIYDAWHILTDNDDNDCQILTDDYDDDTYNNLTAV